MKSNLFLIFLLGFIQFSINAQNNFCGMDDMIEKFKNNDSLFQHKLIEEENKYRNWSKNNGRMLYSQTNIGLKKTNNSVSFSKKNSVSENAESTICPYNNTYKGTFGAPTVINTGFGMSNMYGGDYVRITGMVAGNTYRIYTCGQNDFNTELSIYTVGGLQQVEFNDDACLNNQSEIIFTPTISQSYDILIDESTGCQSTFFTSTIIYISLIYEKGTCGYNNNAYLISPAPTTLYQTVTFPKTWGGDFNTVTNMIAGNIYRIYTCGNTAFDTQISVFSGGGGQAVAFNDDACGSQSELYFTPLSSGNYDILLDVYPCSSNSIDMDVNVALVYVPRQIITIPVVVHVLYNNATENISLAQIQSQIDVLNQDFNLQHAGIYTVPPQFRGLCSNPLIQFCLAQRDPNGNATNGIERTYTSHTSFMLSSDTAIMHTSQGGSDAWDKNQYLNIWVCNIADGTNSGVGFPNHPFIINNYGSYYGGIGVCLWYKSFGTTGTIDSYYSKGKNAVHEIGHWLGLWHLWSYKTANTCNSDSITDTPSQYTSTKGLPLNQTLYDYCTSSFPGLMYYNYMDYPDDVVRNMFTYEQTDRTDYALFNWYASLQTSQGCFPSITGISTNSLESNISIFPNPSKGIFTISQTDEVQNIQLIISNTLGENIFDKRVDELSAEINLHNQPNGIYFIQINTSSEKIIKKLVIQK